MTAPRPPAHPAPHTKTDGGDAEAPGAPHATRRQEAGGSGTVDAGRAGAESAEGTTAARGGDAGEPRTNTGAERSGTGPRHGEDAATAAERGGLATGRTPTGAGPHEARATRTGRSGTPAAGSPGDAGGAPSSGAVPRGASPGAVPGRQPGPPGAGAPGDGRAPSAGVPLGEGEPGRARPARVPGDEAVAGGTGARAGGTGTDAPVAGGGPVRAGEGGTARDGARPGGGLLAGAGRSGDDGPVPPRHDDGPVSPRHGGGGARGTGAPGSEHAGVVAARQHENTAFPAPPGLGAPPAPRTAEDLVTALRGHARAAAHRLERPCSCARRAGAGIPRSPDVAEPVLADRPDGTVVRHGDAVAKAHAPETPPADLAARLAVAAHPALAGVLLPPLGPLVHGLRLVSCWPHGSPVDPHAPELAPWEEAAVLLARLHTADPRALPGPLPPMRGPVKAARAITRMREAAPPRGSGLVLRAWATLPAWARGEVPGPALALCHGDLHLGQLVRHPAPRGPWRLIDIDDLGLGDPAWDLARPAAWHGCGLLSAADWSTFLGAYRAAGGSAVPGEGDPWARLDVPARALTVQTAALALAKATEAGRPLDEAETAVLDACARIAALPPAEAAGNS